MDTDLRPIAFTTACSLALHAALLATTLPAQTPVQHSGPGIEIELVSSTHISNQRKTEQAARKTVATPKPTRPERALKSETVAVQKKPVPGPVSATAAAIPPAASVSESRDDGIGNEVITRSTNAAMQRISIIQLLHARISEHKQYPYLAKRQRREGIARVEFVLHPDGSIDATRLVSSSRVRLLDKAALEAVQGIVPFEPARDFLDEPEAFQVDVVFNMI